MKHRNRTWLIILLISTLFLSFDSPHQQKGWRPIFNGKNLDGWKLKIAGFQVGENFGNTFRVKNGILSIRYDQYGSNFDNRFGALYYDRKLKNYRLKVEYRFVGETAPGAPSWGFRDSGIQYLGQGPESMEIKQQFPACVEFNLHGGNGKDDRPNGELCTPGTMVEIKGKKNADFCTLPDVKKTFHGDQWVTVEIEIRDGKITHFINNEAILKAENARYNPDDDLGKKFATASNPVIKEGFVSLQSNSHPIDFRKIELMEFD